ncbi:MAG: MoaD/ThiS family protein [Cyclobacteriaceae bacterium]|nr:MoaD/ThiS family protein [Cyclobacteriaceae bacterium]
MTLRMEINMIRVKLFGIIREIVGSPILEIEEPLETVGQLKAHMMLTYPRIKGLNSLLIAVNSEYAENEQAIKSTDEIALIPPVSGG